MSRPGSGATRPTVSLRTSADFARVYREGSRTRSDGITAFVLERSDGAGPRIGYAVSKGHGTAVARNRTRRRLRAAVQATDVAGAIDVVVRPDPGSLDEDFQNLVEHVREALTRAIESR